MIASVAAPTKAQLPPLPLPPPPVTGAQRLVGDLVHRLLAQARTLGVGRSFDVRVSIVAGRTPDAFTPFIADALAAALRHRGWLGDRAAADTPGSLAHYLFDVELRVQPPKLFGLVLLRQRPLSVWEELRAPTGSVLAAATAETGLDAELRSLLGLPLKSASIKRVRLRGVALTAAVVGPSPSPALDMWVGDLDGDRRQELILLFADRVVVVGLSPRGAGIVRASFLLGESLPPNPQRVRQPLGRLVAIARRDGSRTLLAAVTDYAHGAALRLSRDKLLPDLGVQAPRLGWPLYQVVVDEVVSAAWPRAVDVLAGAARHERLDGSGGRPAGPLIPVHDVRAFAHHGLNAPHHQAFVLASVAGGGVGLRDPAGAVAVGRHGLGTIVGDLDLDGVAELLVTSAELQPRTDVITAYRLIPGRRRNVLRRIKVRGEVTALAAGDVDGDLRPEYWVAAWTGKRPRLYALGLARRRR